MHYDATGRNHGLKFDPFKALMVPRPIGWISTVDRNGVPNLAPYSFFNAVSDMPPVVMFSSAGHKDSLRNIEESGEFTCSLSTYDLREQMNMSSAAVAPGVDEFKLAGLTATPSKYVKPPRVGESPAAFECRHWKTLEMPSAADGKGKPYTVVFGLVVGIYIDDAFVKDGIVDTPAMKPLARLGYMDYSVLTPETVFSLNRPIATPDGQGANLVPGPWDGVYR
ncbi:MAG TPA: flavin reductase family protein [Burkholderiaceae bacterium]|jgi:flavin reductase (DIM6/NTAB) family NADH-FMN oxidoreductase RutF|nr:flavin reductase family protein [Burkholderiaceae bacterium]